MNYDPCLLHLSFADVEQDRKSAVEVHADVVLHLAHSYMAFQSIDLLSFITNHSHLHHQDTF